MRIILTFMLLSSCTLPLMCQNNPLLNESDSVSYCLGILMGGNIGSAGIDKLSEQYFLKGINDAMTGKEGILTLEQANIYISQYINELNMKKGEENLFEGQQFLSDNAKSEGVISLPSGLQYKVISVGEGKSPVDTSFVTVHYTGKLIDGKVFDSSVERGEPAQFPVNGVIPGWTEALKLMKPGAKWQLFIPPQLAYGERGNRGILPNSVLIFDVELIAVE
jgi:FKBP-type peptidyl-prolyl cis-trans isomerase FklB